MTRDHVGIPLHDHDASLPGLLRPMQPEQHAPFAEERRFRGIEILGWLVVAVGLAAGGARNEAAAEADRAPAFVVDREHHAAGEDLATVAQQPGLFEHLERQMPRLRMTQQRSGSRMMTEAPGFDRGAEPSLLEILTRQPTLG